MTQEETNAAGDDSTPALSAGPPSTPPAPAALGSALLKPTNASFLLRHEFWNILVLFATFIVIIWYTVETSRLRRATEDQIRRTYLPIVVLDVAGSRYAPDSSAEHLRVFLQNVGFGPAFNVQISPIEHMGYTAAFEVVPGLVVDGEYEIAPRISATDTSQHSFPRNLGEFVSMTPARSRRFSNQFPVRVTYTDSRGEVRTLEHTLRWSMANADEIAAYVRFRPDDGIASP